MIGTLALALVIVALVVRDILRERSREASEHLWRMERSELLARIQHPEVYVPPASLRTQDPEEPREPAEDDFERVGGVFYDEGEDA